MGFKNYSKETQLSSDKKKKTSTTNKEEVKTAKVSTVPEHYVNDLGVDSEYELFLILYKNGDKKSFLSGKKIFSPESNGSGLFVGQFAHVLSKAKNKYPHFKLYSKNIILLTNEEHLLLDNGTEEQRKKYADNYKCDWSKVFELRDKLKEEYNMLIK